MKPEHRAIMQCCADTLSRKRSHYVHPDGLIRPGLNNSDQRLVIILTDFWVQVSDHFGTFDLLGEHYRTFRDSPLAEVFDQFQEELRSAGGREREVGVLLILVLESHGRLLRRYDRAFATYRGEDVAPTTEAGET